MKIALAQLDPNEWVNLDENIRKLAAIIEQLNNENIDLIVFPECFPFDEYDRTKIIKLSKANEALKKIRNSIPYICGGYIENDESIIRNSSFLVINGEIKGEYHKRANWKNEEPHKPGADSTKFEWKNDKDEYKACYPLICADINLTKFQKDYKSKADDCPIIFSSFGGGLMTRYWQDPLENWAEATGKNIVICGIAGEYQGATFINQNKIEFFGGGGSGIFSPNKTRVQCKYEGIVIIDTDDLKYQKFIEF
jgi:hypothetical protein